MLDALETGFRAGRRVMALSGPGGLGKTMVLRVLEQRLAAEARCLHLPYAALSTQDLVEWVFGLLDAPQQMGSSEAALRTLAAAGRPLLLLLDDASALPLDTARDLVSWAHAFDGALRLVFVPIDDDRAGRVLAALGDDVLDLRLREPMSEAESLRYIAGRLDRLPDPGEIRERLPEERMAWLHRESAGNPRVLHGLATWLLYSGGAAPDTFMSDRSLWLDTDEVGVELDSLDREKPECAPEVEPGEVPGTALAADASGASARRRRRRRR